MKITRYLWISNLPKNCGENEIKQKFESHGKIQTIRIHENITARGAIIAFIDCKSSTKAFESEHKIKDMAIKMDYCEANGEPGLTAMGLTLDDLIKKNDILTTDNIENNARSRSGSVTSSFGSSIDDTSKYPESKMNDEFEPISNSQSTDNGNSQNDEENTDSNCLNKELRGLLLENLSQRSSDTSLREGLFHEYKKHGKITSVSILGQGSNRYAIISFKRAEDMEKAYDVSQGKIFFGNKIKVKKHNGFNYIDPDLCPPEHAMDEYHPKATKTLFVGKLTTGCVTESDLKRTFKKYGEIIDIDMKTQSNQPETSFAFVQYYDISSVVRALRNQDNIKIDGKSVKLGFGKSQPTNCLWLGNVPNRQLNETNLRRQFRRHGSILFIMPDVEYDCALIQFECVDDAQRALQEVRDKSNNNANNNNFPGVNNQNTMIHRRLQVDFASNEYQIAFMNRLRKSCQFDAQDLLKNCSSGEKLQSLLISCTKYLGLLEDTNKRSQSKSFVGKSEGKGEFDDYDDEENNLRRRSRGSSRHKSSYRRDSYVGGVDDSSSRYHNSRASSHHKRATSRIYEDFSPSLNNSPLRDDYNNRRNKYSPESRHNNNYSSYERNNNNASYYSSHNHSYSPSPVSSGDGNNSYHRYNHRQHDDHSRDSKYVKCSSRSRIPNNHNNGNSSRSNFRNANDCYELSDDFHTRQSRSESISVSPHRTGYHHSSRRRSHNKRYDSPNDKYYYNNNNNNTGGTSNLANHVSSTAADSDDDVDNYNREKPQHQQQHYTTQMKRRGNSSHRSSHSHTRKTSSVTSQSAKTPQHLASNSTNSGAGRLSSSQHTRSYQQHQKSSNFDVAVTSLPFGSHHQLADCTTDQLTNNLTNVNAGIANNTSTNSTANPASGTFNTNPPNADTLSKLERERAKLLQELSMLGEDNSLNNSSSSNNTSNNSIMKSDLEGSIDKLQYPKSFPPISTNSTTNTTTLLHSNQNYNNFSVTTSPKTKINSKPIELDIPSNISTKDQRKNECSTPTPNPNETSWLNNINNNNKLSIPPLSPVNCSLPSLINTSSSHNSNISSNSSTVKLSDPRLSHNNSNSSMLSSPPIQSPYLTPVTPAPVPPQRQQYIRPLSSLFPVPSALSSIDIDTDLTLFTNNHSISTTNITLPTSSITTTTSPTPQKSSLCNISTTALTTSTPLTSLTKSSSVNLHPQHHQHHHHTNNSDSEIDPLESDVDKRIRELDAKLSRTAETTVRTIDYSKFRIKKKSAPSQDVSTPTSNVCSSITGSSVNALISSTVNSSSNDAILSQSSTNFTGEYSLSTTTSSLSREISSNTTDFIKSMLNQTRSKSYTLDTIVDSELYHSSSSSSHHSSTQHHSSSQHLISQVSHSMSTVSNTTTNCGFIQFKTVDLGANDIERRTNAAQLSNYSRFNSHESVVSPKYTMPYNSTSSNIKHIMSSPAHTTSSSSTLSTPTTPLINQQNDLNNPTKSILKKNQYHSNMLGTTNSILHSSPSTTTPCTTPAKLIHHKSHNIESTPTKLSQHSKNELSNYYQKKTQNIKRKSQSESSDDSNINCYKTPPSKKPLKSYDNSSELLHQQIKQQKLQKKQLLSNHSYHYDVKSEEKSTVACVSKKSASRSTVNRSKIQKTNSKLLKESKKASLERQKASNKRQRTKTSNSTSSKSKSTKSKRTKTNSTSSKNRKQVGRKSKVNMMSDNDLDDDEEVCSNNNLNNQSDEITDDEDMNEHPDYFRINGTHFEGEDDDESMYDKIKRRNNKNKQQKKRRKLQQLNRNNKLNRKRHISGTDDGGTGEDDQDYEMETEENDADDITAADDDDDDTEEVEELDLKQYKPSRKRLCLTDDIDSSKPSVSTCQKTVVQMKREMENDYDDEDVDLPKLEANQNDDDEDKSSTGEAPSQLDSIYEADASCITMGINAGILEEVVIDDNHHHHNHVIHHQQHLHDLDIIATSPKVVRQPSLPADVNSASQILANMRSYSPLASNNTLVGEDSKFQSSNVSTVQSTPSLSVGQPSAAVTTTEISSTKSQQSTPNSQQKISNIKLEEQEDDDDDKLRSVAEHLISLSQLTIQNRANVNNSNPSTTTNTCNTQMSVSEESLSITDDEHMSDKSFIVQHHMGQSNTQTQDSGTFEDNDVSNYVKSIIDRIKQETDYTTSTNGTTTNTIISCNNNININNNGSSINKLISTNINSFPACKSSAIIMLNKPIGATIKTQKQIQPQTIYNFNVPLAPTMGSNVSVSDLGNSPIMTISGSPIVVHHNLSNSSINEETCSNGSSSGERRSRHNSNNITSSINATISNNSVGLMSRETAIDETIDSVVKSSMSSSISDRSINDAEEQHSINGAALLQSLEETMNEVINKVSCPSYESTTINHIIATTTPTNPSVSTSVGGLNLVSVNNTTSHNSSISSSASNIIPTVVNNNNMMGNNNNNTVNISNCVVGSNCGLPINSNMLHTATLVQSIQPNNNNNNNNNNNSNTTIDCNNQKKQSVLISAIPQPNLSNKMPNIYHQLTAQPGTNFVLGIPSILTLSSSPNANSNSSNVTNSSGHHELLLTKLTGSHAQATQLMIQQRPTALPTRPVTNPTVIQSNTNNNCNNATIISTLSSVASSSAATTTNTTAKLISDSNLPSLYMLQRHTTTNNNHTTSAAVNSTNQKLAQLIQHHHTSNATPIILSQLPVSLPGSFTSAVISPQTLTAQIPTPPNSAGVGLNTVLNHHSIVNANPTQITNLFLRQILPTPKYIEKMDWLKHNPSALEPQHPVKWSGKLCLKNDELFVQMHMLAGNEDLIKSSMSLIAHNLNLANNNSSNIQTSNNITNNNNNPPLRIVQRMRLDPNSMEGLQRRLTRPNEFCTCLTLAGTDADDQIDKVNCQLSDVFIKYLQDKSAAGIINICIPDSQQNVYVVNIFPPCDFANTQLKLASPKLYERLQEKKIPYLIVIINSN